MTEKRRFDIPGWAVAWVACVLFALLAQWHPEPRHRLEYARIKNHDGMPLWVVAYFPEPAKSTRSPGAIVCQPLNDAPEYGQMLDLELVQDGFVVLTFDWRGRTPEENRQLLRVRTQETIRADVAAAVAWLRSRPEVDPKRIVIAGHSVGGTLAVDEGLADPSIAAVASIGMAADVSPQLPHNLLWAVGLYDEFRSLGRMREVFAASARTQALEGVTVGDFSNGTARRLEVSPTSDHFTELQDSGIHRIVLQWFNQAVGLPSLSRRMWMDARGLFVMLAWIAALAGALLTLRRFAHRRVGRMRIAIALAWLGILLLSFARGADFLQATDAVLVLFLFGLVGGALTALDDQQYKTLWRSALRLGLVLYASLLLTLVFNNLPYYFRTPGYMLSLPEFAVLHILNLADGYLFDYSRPLLFSVYSPQGLSAHWWIFVLVGIEALFPGFLIGSVASLVRRSRKREAAKRTVSPVSLVALLALTGFLAVLVWLRLEQGFLTGESARAALRFLLRFTVLPFFVFAFLWRLTGKRKPNRENGRLAQINS